ncbi:hypothetical protein FB107DRAFT_224824 [Schizophyllum commune]
MTAEKRDPQRRRESKRAYYERHKKRLREQARQRAEAQRGDPVAREARLQAMRTYREKHAMELRLRRLNYRRRVFIQQHGVSAFRERYISRLSSSEYYSIPHGYLLEDHDDEELIPIHTYHEGPS